MEKFEVIVVGGGLAGLAAAYCLAKDGIEVLVVERGDYSGAKNVTGGRLYLNPVRHLLPDIWDEAPLERYVGQEIITLMGENSSTSIRLSSERFREKPYHSFTILRAKFDKWFSEKVAEAGGMIVTKQKVDDLIQENGKVQGIVAGEDKIYANVVLVADGAISLITQKVGLRGNHQPKDFAVGIKEIIEMPSQTIEERFNLGDGEGAAQLYVGSITRGMFGGGFLYTNLGSISLGIVVGIKDLMERQPPIEAPQLIDEFKERPEVASLIKGGETVEYSAHTISEGGINTMPRLYSDGILVAGDAAGFTLNTGLTVRGMEFALASGVLAAKVIKRSVEKKDFSKQSLSYYESLLRDSFIMKDLNTFKGAPHFLDNRNLFTLYPQFVGDTLEKLMFIDDEPKRKLSSTVLGQVRRLCPSLLKDIWGAFRI